MRGWSVKVPSTFLVPVFRHEIWGCCFLATCCVQGAASWRKQTIQSSASYIQTLPRCRKSTPGLDGQGCQMPPIWERFRTQSASPIPRDTLAGSRAQVPQTDADIRCSPVRYHIEAQIPGIGFALPVIGSTFLRARRR